MSMNLFNNANDYFKVLTQYKKLYRQRGMYKRCCNVGNLKPYYDRFGDLHFKSDLKEQILNQNK